MDRLAVIIPAFGKIDLTHAVIQDALRERDLVDLVVVDNKGDYSPTANETVLATGRNLGWLRGTNLGLSYAHTKWPNSCLVGLNNDTRLSKQFFAGLLDAANAAGEESLVAPLYDDSFPAQRSSYRGAADDFRAQELEVRVRVVDGTCVLITALAFNKLGSFDERRFGSRGWGGIEDYCLRANAAEVGVYVTHRAYLNHAPGQTASVVDPGYKRYASAELRRGMRKKWGPDWRVLLDGEDRPRDRSDVVLRDFLRSIEDRAGISRTEVGRHGLRQAVSRRLP